MLNEILHNAEKFKAKIAELRELSPVYPEIFIQNTFRVIWATTMVKFTYHDVVYLRHHVECYHKDFSTNQDNQLMEDSIKARLSSAAQKCISYGLPAQGDTVHCKL